MATYLSPCIGMLLSHVLVSPTETDTVLRADILLAERSQSQPPFNVWGSEGGSVLKARDFLDQQGQLLLGEILQGLGGRKGKKGMVCPLPTSRVYEVGICAVCAYCGEVYCTV